MARGRQDSRDVWEARLARWGRSTLTADEFAQREGVSRGQLTWWVGRLRTLERDAGTPETAFVELQPSPVGVGVEVVLRRGAVLRISVGFDGDTVLRLVRVLEGDAP